MTTLLLAVLYILVGYVIGRQERKDRRATHALPEPPAEVDRPAGTNRCTVNVAGHALYVTTSMDSGQLMRK